jgi:hypothetical protein
MHTQRVRDTGIELDVMGSARRMESEVDVIKMSGILSSRSLASHLTSRWKGMRNMVVPKSSVFLDFVLQTEIGKV